jgi:hypothetical protein
VKRGKAFQARGSRDIVKGIEEISVQVVVVSFREETMNKLERVQHFGI